MTHPTRPNIVFIVADDLGYADLGCYGGRDASFGPVSPVLDGLAARGLKLTQGYSNSPVCSPTRFALMTGRYQYRLRGAAEEPINSKSRGSTTLGLPPEHPTLPSLLRDAGYRTALMGKWHLGYPPAFGPLRSGYDEFFGPMSGGVDYFTHCSSTGQHDLYLGDAEQQVRHGLGVGVVQRGGRLIGNHQLRVGNQHHGNHDALPLSAGYLMRIKLINALRLANTHHLQHLQRLCLRLIFASRMMGQPGLGDLLTDADHRIERIFRVLHNHGDTFAAHAAHLRFSKMQQIEVGKLHPAGADAGLFRMQLQQGAPNGGFT